MAHTTEFSPVNPLAQTARVLVLCNKWTLIVDAAGWKTLGISEPGNRLSNRHPHLVRQEQKWGLPCLTQVTQERYSAVHLWGRWIEHLTQERSIWKFFHAQVGDP